MRWSDECSVVRGEGVRDTWTTCSRRYTKDVLGSFGTDGVPESGRRRVTADIYIKVLRKNLPAFLSRGDIFMQDGAGIHRARIASEFFNEIGVTLADWPPYSPNLNPIENLESLLKQAIYKKYLELEFAG